jgi:ubiquinone/menaquinone biosynthesis C-methylase UbiE
MTVWTAPFPRESWDRDYRNRGRRFGRAAPNLPSLPPGAVILETGCGDGKTLSGMVNRGWEIVAIDFSAEAIGLCRSSPALRKLCYLVADAGRLPLKGCSCDAVFLSHVIGHAPEAERELIASESLRVLKRGGLLFFRGFSTADFRAGSGTLMEPGTRIRGDGIMTHYLTREEVMDLFADLIPVSVREETWVLRVKKERLRRAEIIAEFRKQ